MMTEVLRQGGVIFAPALLKTFAKERFWSQSLAKVLSRDEHAPSSNF